MRLIKYYLGLIQQAKLLNMTRKRF